MTGLDKRILIWSLSLGALLLVVGIVLRPVNLQIATGVIIAGVMGLIFAGVIWLNEGPWFRNKR
ncbi:ABC-type Mn2+/Zn2+ transport system permease subunit [Thermocatellispora tengchongensis]|uniref:ABC-type Mn2+/Zn2+ transport system permease subunit n=1 Tax=Thermocatellispora tengchongensis TaxID=1073253 RepID=A0A840P105_9ACTN|nr:hypothetical protein [Thermocatellispora tengchongensis]MBB5132659.1 ABC-type Mn2+/Zn2+ transport system permease subunit [Thermocatellispora tengchongensis]